MGGLTGVCVLAGASLTPLFEAQLEWRGDAFTRLEGAPSGPTPRFVVLPPFVNSHTHLGDSVAKEASSGLTLEEAVDPHTGIKSKILAQAGRGEIVSAMRKSIARALACGTATIVDFREGGEEGVRLLREAASGGGVEVKAFGRLSHPPEPARVRANEDFTQQEIEELYRVCAASDGLGVSGANEYSDKMLQTLRRVADECGRKVAVHVLESKRTRMRSNTLFGRDELARTLSLLRPDIAVHLTDATGAELQELSRIGVGVVMCPRSNACLGNGLPPLREGLSLGAALGTDNVMVNSADMFREMEFAYKCVLAAHSDPRAASPRDVLAAATVSGDRLLGGGGGIRVGGRADFVVLDLGRADCLPTANLYATVVNRCSAENVACVVKGGKVVWGTLDLG